MAEKKRRNGLGWKRIDGRTWSYSVGSDGTASVEGVSPNDGSVEIPFAIDGYSVTRIGDWAFDGCCGLMSVTIPSSVTCIGKCVFDGCSGLEKVVFEGDAPFFESEESFLWDVRLCSAVVYVKPDSTGWDVEIPGTWMGCRIEYVSADSAETKGDVANGAVD